MPARLLLGPEHGGRALVSLDHQDVDGKTALQLASFQGDAECVALLLAAGADACLSDHRGLHPLHIAAWQGHPECVALLLDFHAAACALLPTATATTATATATGVAVPSVSLSPSSLAEQGQPQQEQSSQQPRRRRGPFCDEEEDEAEGEGVSLSSVSSSLLAASMRRLRGLGVPAGHTQQQEHQGAAAAAAGAAAAASPHGSGGARRRDYWSVVDAVDSRGRSALYMATTYEQEEVVAVLLGAFSIVCLFVLGMRVVCCLEWLLW